MNVENNPYQDANQPEAKPPAAASINVGKINTEGNTDNSKKRRKRKPLSRFEIWTVILAIFGILVAAGTGIAVFWQARISAKTLTEIQNGGKDTHDLAVAAGQQATAAGKQADADKTIADSAKIQASNTSQQASLMQQQLEGTMATVVTCVVGVSIWEDDGTPYGGDTEVSFQNKGHVAARQVRGMIEWYKVSLPDGHQIGKTHVSIIPAFDIPAPAEHVSNQASRDYKFTLNENERQEMAHAQLSVEVRAKLTYLDGFVRIPRTMNDCEMLLYLRLDPAQDGLIENTSFPCQDLATRYETLESDKAEYERKHNTKRNQ